MSQLYLFLILLILVLFLMYVYKKKCDEDYYISLIQFNQQYFCPFQTKYNLGQNYPFQRSISNPPNYINNFNQIKDDYIYKTPKRKKSFNIYKDFSGLNNVSPSPSPNNNYTSRQIIYDKNLYYNIKKNDNVLYDNFYGNDLMNKNLGNYYGHICNKKVFKLEDFLTDSKMKKIDNNRFKTEFL